MRACPPRARDWMRTMAESRVLAPRGDLARAEGASSHAAAPELIPHDLAAAVAVRLLEGCLLVRVARVKPHLVRVRVRVEVRPWSGADGRRGVGDAWCLVQGAWCWCRLRGAAGSHPGEDGAERSLGDTAGAVTVRKAEGRPQPLLEAAQVRRLGAVPQQRRLGIRRVRRGCGGCGGGCCGGCGCGGGCGGGGGGRGRGRHGVGEARGRDGERDGGALHELAVEAWLGVRG
eukprot:scaffold57150_cov41-Phaeocystis_antarctica.AAC.1